jgi:hypothetical protein
MGSASRIAGSRLDSVAPMAEEAQQELIESRLEAQINSFKRSKNFYRRGSLLFTLGTAVLAALTTLLVGLRELYSERWISGIALVAGGMTTVVSAWGGWFAFRRMWIDNQATLNALYRLRLRLHYLKAASPSGGTLSRSELDDIYTEFQSILDAANQGWADVRSAGNS